MIGVTGTEYSPRRARSLLAGLSDAQPSLLKAFEWCIKADDMRLKKLYDMNR